MQWDDGLRDSLQHLAPYLVWVLAGLGLSILVALIREPLSRILRDTGEQVRAARQRLQIRWALSLGRKAKRFWAARLHEPIRPVTDALDRLIAVLPQIGTHSLPRLSALQAELSRSLRALEALTLQAPTADMLRQGMATGAAPGSWGKLSMLALVAALTGIANSFLLNQFFQGVITSDPLLPSLFPGLHVSHVLAALIFMMEVGIGFALHHFSEEQSGSPAQQFLATAPWLVLGGLVCLEGWAYALLSYQIDLPQRLNLSPESSFYPFARYFLALFGAGLTLLLTSLGYLLGKESLALQRGRELRRQRRLLRRFSRAIAGGPDRVARTHRALENLKASAQSFQPDLVRQFEREIQAVSQSDQLPTAIRRALETVTASGRIDRTMAAGPVRTQSQVLADIALYSSALLLLALVSWLSVQYIAAFVDRIHDGRSGGPAAGVLLTAFALAAGYLAVASLGRTQYLSGARLPAARSWGRGVAALAIALATGVLVAIAISNGTLGSWQPLNGLFGVIHAGVLFLLGATFDRSVINTFYLLQLFTLVLAQAVAWAAAMLLLVVQGALLAIDWGLRVISVFGQLIVRPRPTVRLGVVEVSRSPVRGKHG